MRNKRKNFIGLGVETLGVMIYLAFLFILTVVTT